MTKAELIDRIARSRNLPADISKKDLDRIVTLVFEEIAGFFVRSRVTRNQTPRFTFPHFGTFVKKRRPARNGVNPRTLEPMQIDAFCTIDFRPSGELRDAMNPAASGDSRKRGANNGSKRGQGEVEDSDRDAAEDLPTAPLSRVRSEPGKPRTRTAS